MPVRPAIIGVHPREEIRVEVGRGGRGGLLRERGCRFKSDEMKTRTSIDTEKPCGSVF